VEHWGTAHAVSLDDVIGSFAEQALAPGYRGRVLTELVNGAARRGAEVGVFAGDLSGYLLKHNPHLHLYMVDRWRADETYVDVLKEMTAQKWEHVKAAALAHTEFAADRRTILHADSVPAAAQVEDGTLDFAFIDGDHGYAGCYADIVAWWPKVRIGGFLCGHDFGCPYQGVGVVRAVALFCAERDLRYGTATDWVWWTRKEPDGN
jgi:hypothetical protein